MNPTGMNQDFIDVLGELIDSDVEFVVVGAHALAVHGIPRATGDIDILVRPDRINARKVLAALRSFGTPVDGHGVTEEDLANQGYVYQIGLPPRRIDILTELSGLSFDEVWQTKLQVRVGEIDVFFIGRDAMIKNKTTLSRAKDLADVEAIKGD